MALLISPLPPTARIALVAWVYRGAVTGGLAWALHIGQRHAPALSPWIFAAGGLVYARWLLTRNRLASVRLGRILLFAELLVQFLFLDLADGAIGSWLVGIWRDSWFGAGLPSGLLLATLGISGRWGAAHVKGGGSRWILAGRRKLAVSLANVINLPYGILVRSVPLFLLAGVLYPERDLLAALVPLLVSELVLAVVDRSALRSPDGLWTAWLFFIPRRVMACIPRDTWWRQWAIGSWLYDAIWTRRGSADYTLVINLMRLWLLAHRNDFLTVVKRKLGDPPKESAVAYLATAHVLLAEADRVEEARVHAGRSGDGGRRNAAAYALTAAFDCYARRMPGGPDPEASLATVISFREAGADSWALLYGAVAAARLTNLSRRNPNRAAALLRDVLTATTEGGENLPHAAVRTAVAVTAGLTHEFGRQAETIRLLERINHTPPYPAEVRRMTAEHWQLYPLWARHALWDVASFEIFDYLSNRGVKEDLESDNERLDKALTTLLGSRWGNTPSALPDLGMHWLGLAGDRFRSPEHAVLEPFDRTAALAEAQGCLDRLVAAFGPDLPAFGGRSAADDIERERARRRKGPGTSGGDPVQRWATERDGAHRAFGFVERFRSQELSYLLGKPADLAWTRVRTDVAMPADLLASTEQAEAAYELAWKGVAGAPEDRAEAWRRVTDAYQALESLGSSSLASAGRGNTPWLDYPQARALLQDLHRAGRRVLLALYWQVGTQVTVLIARHDYDRPVAVTVDLPPDDELRETLRGLSEAPGVGHPFGAAPGGTSWERVFRPLVAPLVEHSAEGDPIWLVPSGILHHVPLHAVGWRDSVTLCERNPVTVTPSATVMTRLLAPRRGTGGGSVLLVADSDAERPLAHARTEVETAATALGADGERLVGERATKTAVLARIALGGMDIVHLACHGRFDAAAPLDSWIQLAPDPLAPGPSDRLTARELCGLRLDVRLVTLSACESGLGDPSLENERMGFVWGLLQSGVRSALVSLWRVDDISTAILMSHFYQALSRGDGPGQALQHARDRLRRTTVADALRLCETALRRVPESDERGRRTTLRRIAELHMQAGEFGEALGVLDELRDRTDEADPEYPRLLVDSAQCRRRATRASAADHGRKIFDHPYYWAPFQLIGDWR